VTGWCADGVFYQIVFIGHRQIVKSQNLRYPKFLEFAKQITFQNMVENFYHSVKNDCRETLGVCVGF
jgi:hypothetical protein